MTLPPIPIIQRGYYMKSNFKRFILVSVALILALLCLASCKKEPEKSNDTPTYYNATFNFNNGQEPYTVQFKRGALITPPISPERENYIFNGWKSEGKTWDFSKDLTNSDVVFTAQWIDASSIFGYSTNSDGTITLTEYRGSLTEIRIPEVISGLTVTAIGDGVFKNFEGVGATVITVPETVTDIGASAFEGCTTTAVKILGEISVLGERAFDGCAKLSGIKLSENVTEIPFRAFAGCSLLTEMTLPKNVTKINEDAFWGCASIKTLVVLSPELLVDDSAFAGCDGLLSVFFVGNDTEWKTVLLGVSDGGNGNDKFKKANVFFYSENEPEGENKSSFWHFNNKGEPRCW